MPAWHRVVLEAISHAFLCLLLSELFPERQAAAK